jgi:conjugative relaxase-like TrwC/TraI family protein
MFTVSPVSAGHATAYFAAEFAAEYYAGPEQIPGTWGGRLSQEYGLDGSAVTADQFNRMADGRHPVTDAPLVRHRQAGEGHVQHRSGWDFTASSPKTVSLAALADPGVRDAHRAAVTVALTELERYAQARVSSHASETTGRLIYTRFEHETARPVHGEAGAPQLHDHVLVWNVQQTAAGETRSLQPLEAYRARALATAVYRGELAAQLVARGYTVDRGPHHEPVIRGFTPEYVAASSPRTKQIEDRVAELGLSGPVAAKVATIETRERKVDLTRAEIRATHLALAAEYGNQPWHVAEGAHERVLRHEPMQAPDITAAAALAYARDKGFEREAVVDERRLLTEALVRSMGAQTPAAIRAELEQRISRGDHTASRQLTTPHMQALERAVLERMRDGQGTRPELADAATRITVARSHDLSDHQWAAVNQILTNTDQVQALQGYAGTGKTTTLAAVRQAAEGSGYRVEGMAPTSRAAQQLADAGIPSSTLQKHLADTRAPATGKRLLVLDESSLASTNQMHELLRRLPPQDRVLLVGDIKQHQAVDAGQPFQQLQDAGIATTRLSEIVRQRDAPELKAVVEQLARGETREAIGALDAGGHVHEVTNREDRYRAIANAYVQQPTGTLVVSPDNESRQQLNRVIHTSLQEAGLVDRREHRMTVLVPRQELTGADRAWAEQYQRGDVVRWSKGSRAQDIAPGAYGTVERVNRHTVRVRLDTGETRTWDPARAHGVTVYREAERTMAIGEKIQTTTPDRQRSIANHELGTVQRIDTDGTVSITMDSGRRLTLAADARKHVDFGYAVTSHSSQGLTADRVLLHVDTTQAPTLNNHRLAYVALSRGRDTAEIYTDSRARLGPALHSEVSQHSALEPAEHEHVVDAHPRAEQRQEQHQHEHITPHNGYGF